jgi:hypothetical protein
MFFEPELNLTLASEETQTSTKHGMLFARTISHDLWIDADFDFSPHSGICLVVSYRRVEGVCLERKTGTVLHWRSHSRVRKVGKTNLGKPKSETNIYHFT